MPDQNVIEVVGGVREMGTDETKIWATDVAAVSSVPLTPVLLRVVDEEIPGTDLSTTVFPSGSPAVAGTIVTLQAMVGSALTEGRMYRVYFTVTDSGNTHVFFFRVWVPVYSTTVELLTVPQLIEHLETDVAGSVLSRLLDAANEEIVEAVGPHAVDGDLTILTVGGFDILTLARAALTITSITEVVNDTTTVLGTDDFRIWYNGHTLQRLNDGTNPRVTWGDRVTVVYAPIGDNARRRLALVDLVKLEVTRGAFQTESVGDYRVAYLDRNKEKDAIIQRLMPPVGMFV